MMHDAQTFAGKSALVLALLVTLAYLPAFPGSFLWDDDSALIENPHIHEPDGWSRIWFTREAIEYYPIYYTSLRMQWTLFGAHPSGYLAVNILLHFCNVLLFWVLLRRLGVRHAYGAACFFALHPAAVHAVAWINQHKTVLSTLFYLLSTLLILLHVGTRVSPRSRVRENVAEWNPDSTDPPSHDGGDGAGESKAAHPALFILGFIAFLAGLLTKPTLVLLPLVLMAIARLLHGVSVRRLCVWFAPWLVVAGAIGMLRLVWQPPPPLLDLSPGRGGEGWLSWAVAGCSTWYSAWKIVVPVDLAMIYPRWPIETWTHWALIPLGMVCIVLALLWKCRKKFPRLWIGGLFYVLALAPISGLFDNTFFAFSHIANHWWYPAMLGLIPIAVVGLHLLLGQFPLQNKVLQRGVPRALVALLFILTARESYRFHDPYYFYERGTRENPDNVVAHHHLANLLAEQGEADAALKHYLEAIRIHPRFWQARVQAGKILSAQGRLKESFDQFWGAFDVHPHDPEINFHLGVLYGQADQPENAIVHLQRAISLYDSDPVAWNNLGTAYFRSGAMEQAVHAFQQALVLNPDYEAAARNLEHAREHLH